MISDISPEYDTSVLIDKLVVEYENNFSKIRAALVRIQRQYQNFAAMDYQEGREGKYLYSLDMITYLQEAEREFTI
jgi:hypothetical protein